MDRGEAVTDQKPPDLDARGQPVGAPPDLDANGQPIHADSGVPTVHASDMLSRRGIGITSMDPADEKPKDTWLSRLAGSLEPVAHPTSASDFAPLALGSFGSEAGPAMIRGYLRAGKEAVEAAPNLRSVPKEMIRSLYRSAVDTQQPGVRAFNEMPLAKQMEGLPTDRPAPQRGVPQPPLRIQSPPPDSALSDADLAAKEAAAGRLDPSIAARIKQQSQFGQRPTVPRIQVDPASVPQSWRTSGSSALAPEPLDIPSTQPLGQPRVMTLKDTPTSWTPEAARARIENGQWESGLEPGSAEAHGASSLHRADAEMSSRLKFLMDNPNAALALGSGGALLREALLSRLRNGLGNTPQGR